MTAGVLIGVDLVDVPRIARAHRGLGEQFVSAMGVWESDSTYHPLSHRDVAVKFAVLECIVKAVGGRYAGVSLSDLDPEPYCRKSELADSIASAMSSEACFDLRGQTSCRLRGATERCARTLLENMSNPNLQSSPVVHLRWGERDELLVAIALISNEAHERKAA